MVTTKDVERFVNVMVTTMALAGKYAKDWPKSSEAILAMIREEIPAGLLKVLARPFSEIEDAKVYSELDGLRGERGIVIKSSWSMSNLVPGQHLICLRRERREFVMVDRGNLTVRVGDKLMARIIGGPEYPGNMHLFIDACSWAVEEQLQEREKALRAVRERCLLQHMYKAFGPDEFDALGKLVSDLSDPVA